MGETQINGFSMFLNQQIKFKDHFALHRPNWRKQKKRDLPEKRQPNNRLKNSRNNRKKQLRNYEKKNKRELTTDSWDWSTTRSHNVCYRRGCLRKRRLRSSMIVRHSWQILAKLIKFISKGLFSIFLIGYRFFSVGPVILSCFGLVISDLGFKARVVPHLRDYLPKRNSSL